MYEIKHTSKEFVNVSGSKEENRAIKTIHIKDEGNYSIYKIHYTLKGENPADSFVLVNKIMDRHAGRLSKKYMLPDFIRVDGYDINGSAYANVFGEVQLDKGCFDVPEGSNLMLICASKQPVAFNDDCFKGAKAVRLILPADMALYELTKKTEQGHQGSSWLMIARKELNPLSAYPAKQFDRNEVTVSKSGKIKVSPNRVFNRKTDREESIIKTKKEESKIKIAVAKVSAKPAAKDRVA